ncbi:MAG: DUF2807 domain-containing protein [Cyclobacteriaceae bacterium]|nr:DUF2807 domain-containing protein [Cyclobacteriaceae bacterium]
MRRFNLFVLFLLCVSVSFGQQSEDRAVSHFSGIKVSDGIDLYLRQGGVEKVQVEADDIDIDRIITDVSANTLRIHIEGNSYRSFDVKVYVTFKELEEISASAAANVYSEGVIKVKNLEVSVSSAADVVLEVESADLEVSVSSSGDLELSGRTERFDASVSSAGDLDAYDLDAGEVRVRASSAGDARVTVTKFLDARASSAGSIRYRGNPSQSNTDSSSGGSVRKSG